MTRPDRIVILLSKDSTEVSNGFPLQLKLQCNPEILYEVPRRRVVNWSILNNPHHT